MLQYEYITYNKIHDIIDDIEDKFEFEYIKDCIIDYMFKNDIIEDIKQYMWRAYVVLYDNKPLSFLVDNMISYIDNKEELYEIIKYIYDEVNIDIIDYIAQEKEYIR